MYAEYCRRCWRCVASRQLCGGHLLLALVAHFAVVKSGFLVLGVVGLPWLAVMGEQFPRALENLNIDKGEFFLAIN